MDRNNSKKNKEKEKLNATNTALYKLEKNYAKKLIQRNMGIF